LRRLSYCCTTTHACAIPGSVIDKTFGDKYVAPGTALEKYNKVKRFRTFSQGSMK
jgi:hypothetical protein